VIRCGGFASSVDSGASCSDAAVAAFGDALAYFRRFRGGRRGAGSAGRSASKLRQFCRLQALGEAPVGNRWCYETPYRYRSRSPFLKLPAHLVGSASRIICSTRLWNSATGAGFLTEPGNAHIRAFGSRFFWPMTTSANLSQITTNTPSTSVSASALLTRVRTTHSRRRWCRAAPPRNKKVPRELRVAT